MKRSRPALKSKRNAAAASKSVWAVPIALAVVLLGGLALRLWGIEWGLPSAAHPDYSYHPDEGFTLLWARWLVQGEIIAKHFIYGGTFYYTILNAFVFFGRLWGDSLSGINLLADSILVGRYFMTLVALISILLVYECGRLLYDRMTGLLAALLLAVTPGHVHWAQQVRPDEISALFVLCALYMAARMLRAERFQPRRAALAIGALGGIVLAFRFPLVVICGMPLLAFYMRERRDAAARLQYGAYAYHTALAAGAAVLGYIVVSPHTLIYLRSAIEGLRVTLSYESSIFVDAYDNGPLFYQHLVGSVSQALGYPVYALGLAGVAYAAWRRNDADRIVLVGSGLYAVTMVLASWVVVRYALPLVPLLVLLAARAVVDGLRRAPTTAAKLTVGVVAALLVLGTVFATAAFLRVEAAPNVRDRTADWMQQNIPAGARILMVQSYFGDDFFNPPASSRHHVEYFVLDQQNDSAQIFKLRNYDYVVLAETLYKNMERLGARHPLKQWHVFYESLAEYGYEQWYEFKIPVELAGIDFSRMYSAPDYVVVNPGMRIYRRQARRAFVPGMPRGASA